MHLSDMYHYYIFQLSIPSPQKYSQPALVFPQYLLSFNILDTLLIYSLLFIICFFLVEYKFKENEDYYLFCSLLYEHIEHCHNPCITEEINLYLSPLCYRSQLQKKQVLSTLQKEDYQSPQSEESTFTFPKDHLILSLEEYQCPEGKKHN